MDDEAVEGGVEAFESRLRTTSDELKSVETEGKEIEGMRMTLAVDDEGGIVLFGSVSAEGGVSVVLEAACSVGAARDAEVGFDDAATAATGTGLYE